MCTDEQSILSKKCSRIYPELKRFVYIDIKERLTIKFYLHKLIQFVYSYKFILD